MPAGEASTVPRKWISLPSIVKGIVAVPETDPRAKSIRKVPVKRRVRERAHELHRARGRTACS